MELTINHQKKVFDELPPSLEALIHLENQGKSKGIAVAINNQVIPKEQWPSTKLQHTDAILIVTATQGG